RTANKGFPAASYRTAPHKHPPVIISHLENASLVGEREMKIHEPDIERDFLPAISRRRADALSSRDQRIFGGLKTLSQRSPLSAKPWSRTARSSSSADRAPSAHCTSRRKSTRSAAAGA